MYASSSNNRYHNDWKSRIEKTEQKKKKEEVKRTKINKCEILRFS